MRKINLKSILHMVVILSVLTSLLLCLNGCKKTPDSTPITSAPTETTVNTTPSTDTTPSTADTIPSTADTTPSTTDTTPTETTVPTVETTVNPCEHVFGNWIVEKPSTCTTEGSRYKECTLCKEKAETEAIPTTPHSASEWKIDKKASCTAEGSQHQECTQCEKKLIRIIVSKTDHKAYGIKGYDATETTPGLTQGYLCSDCGAIVQEQFTIPPLSTIGLTYAVGEDGKTCTVTGLVNKEDVAMILPNAIDGYTITAIADGAFSDCVALKTVYLPNTVTSIGAQAFSGCTLLTNITYEGTTAQWLTVAKGADWNANTGAYKIYCTNNNLSK